MPENEGLQSYITELRRGSLTMAVLGSLKEPHYGYALLQTLKDRGLPMETNTLYPLLRRLEGQGLLLSDWDVGESRPRKYYRISERGREVLKELLAQWTQLGLSIKQICGEDIEDGK